MTAATTTATIVTSEHGATTMPSVTKLKHSFSMAIFGSGKEKSKKCE
jgi:hypothetical protein